MVQHDGTKIVHWSLLVKRWVTEVIEMFIFYITEHMHLRM